MNYRYEVHSVTPLVYDSVKLGDTYLGGGVIDGISGMNNDILLVIAIPMDLIECESIEIGDDLSG